MPLPEKCIELDIPEKVIKILQADVYIQNLIQRKDMKTKQVDYYIYNEPFQQSLVNGNVAIAVYSLGEQEQDLSYSAVYMYRDIFYICVFFQNANRGDAIKGCIRLASKIKKIIDESLERNLNNPKSKRTYPIKSEMGESVYTHVLIIEMQTNAHS